MHSSPIRAPSRRGGRGRSRVRYPFASPPIGPSPGGCHPRAGGSDRPFRRIGKDVAMAGRPKNRLELRRQYEAAEPVDPMEDESDELADDSGDDDEEEK